MPLNLKPRLESEPTTVLFALSGKICPIDYLDFCDRLGKRLRIHPDLIRAAVPTILMESLHARMGSEVSPQEELEFQELSLKANACITRALDETRSNHSGGRPGETNADVPGTSGGPG